MARLYDDGSSEYDGRATAPVTSFPTTMACWFYSDDDSVYQSLLCLADSASNDNLDLLIRKSGATNELTVQVSGDAGGGYADARTSTQWSQDTWHHACGVWASNTSMSAYLDGGGKDTDSSNIGASTDWNYWSIGVMKRDTTPDYFYYMSGRIAEVGLWNVALSDAEVAMLAAGFCPLMVRPDKLVSYHGMGGIYGRHINDMVGGYDLTEYNTPSWADHPPHIIYPNTAMMIIAPPLAAAMNSRRSLLGVGV